MDLEIALKSAAVLAGFLYLLVLRVRQVRIERKTDRILSLLQVRPRRSGQEMSVTVTAEDRASEVLDRIRCKAEATAAACEKAAKAMEPLE